MATDRLPEPRLQGYTEHRRHAAVANGRTLLAGRQVPEASPEAVKTNRLLNAQDRRDAAQARAAAFLATRGTC